MKIFFVLTPAYNPNDGGVQRTTSKMGKYFFEQGHEVFYYSMDNEGSIVSDFGTVLSSDEPRGVKNKNNINKLKATVTEIAPDIVINQMPPEKELRTALAELKGQVGYKLIGCLRNSLFKVKDDTRATAKSSLGPLFKFFDHKIGIWLYFQLFKLNFARRLRDIIDKHDYYVLLAPPNRQELEYYVGNYKPEKVHVVPNSIPFVDYSGAQQKDKTILYVGRLEVMQKRVDLLLPIWKKIQSRLPDWKFQIIGDGPYREEMERQIKAEGIPNVEMLGYQKPEPFYQKASIFVMTSSFEGFPNVILEAQSYGLITVVYNSYIVLPWLVNDNEDSFLVEPYDIDAMANKITEIAAQPEKMAMMSERALVNASKFTIDNVGKLWIEFFNKIS